MNVFFQTFSLTLELSPELMQLPEIFLELSLEFQSLWQTSLNNFKGVNSWI
jgi:hypothetical protein